MPIAPIPQNNRSKVGNGSRLHVVEVDGRTAEARRFRDIFSEITSDLGGSDLLSEAQRQLARLAAAMSVEAELMAAKSISGEVPLDTDAFGKLADRMGRVFSRLGIRRVAREVGPQSIHEYAALKRASREAAQ